MSDPFVFDTGPLRHFALQGWLGVLKFLTHERGLVVPNEVRYELSRQASAEPLLQQVLDADWIQMDMSDDTHYLIAFSGYERMLVPKGSQENLGEVGVLALGKTRQWEMVLDDSEPRQIAEDDSLRVTATLPLLCEAIRAGQLTVPMVEHLADDLITGKYFLPFPRGEFRRWANEQGLLE